MKLPDVLGGYTEGTRCLPGVIRIIFSSLYSGTENKFSPGYAGAPRTTPDACPVSTWWCRRQHGWSRSDDPGWSVVRSVNVSKPLKYLVFISRGMVFSLTEPSQVKLLLACTTYSLNFFLSNCHFQNLSLKIRNYRPIRRMVPSNMLKRSCHNSNSSWDLLEQTLITLLSRNNHTNIHLLCWIFSIHFPTKDFFLFLLLFIMHISLYIGCMPFSSSLSCSVVWSIYEKNKRLNPNKLQQKWFHLHLTWNSLLINIVMFFWIYWMWKDWRTYFLCLWSWQGIAGVR